MIVGFAGKKQSGKSTAAESLAKAGYTRYSFAYPLRAMADHMLKLLGFDYADRCEIHADKEGLIQPLGVSIRHVLQTLGTEWGRQLIHPDLWVMCAEHYLNSVDDDVVIDDVRFENEASLIRRMHGVVIHLRRPGLIDNDAHASEAGIEMHADDVIVYNHGSPYLLRDDVAEAVSRFISGEGMYDAYQ